MCNMRPFVKSLTAALWGLANADEKEIAIDETEWN